MKVEGEFAHLFEIIDLSSMQSIPGTLVCGDDQAGSCVMRDKTGELKSYSFGQHRIRLIHKRRP